MNEKCYFFLETYLPQWQKLILDALVMSTPEYSYSGFVYNFLWSVSDHCSTTWSVSVSLLYAEVLGLADLFDFDSFNDDDQAQSKAMANVIALKGPIPTFSKYYVMNNTKGMKIIS